MKNKKRLLVLIIVMFIISLESYNVCNNILAKKTYRNEIKKEIIVSDTVNKELQQEADVAMAIVETETSNNNEPKVEAKEKKENIQVVQEQNQATVSPSIPEASATTSNTQNTGNVENTVVDLVETIKQNADTLGTAGRLYIPSVNVSVGLYYANATIGGNAQKIVDNQDSAAYFQIANQSLIADHNHQGFHKITNVSVGDKAYIKVANGNVVVYRATNKLEGRNLGQDLVDLNGTSMLDGSGNMITYTCYKTTEYVDHVMIVTWELEG